MDDGADVRFVDTHSERHRSDDNSQLAGHELLLDGSASGGRQSGVIRFCTPRNASPVRLGFTVHVLHRVLEINQS